MAVPTCPRCEGHAFEVAVFTPLGEGYRLQMVQCASCGTPVAALDPAPAAEISRLAAQVAALEVRLAQVVAALTR